MFVVTNMLSLDMLVIRLRVGPVQVYALASNLISAAGKPLEPASEEAVRVEAGAAAPDTPAAALAG